MTAARYRSLVSFLVHVDFYHYDETSTGYSSVSELLRTNKRNIVHKTLISFFMNM